MNGKEKNIFLMFVFCVMIWKGDLRRHLVNLTHVKGSVNS